jgi:F0F1-type ATP synthase epsilon subunit
MKCTIISPAGREEFQDISSIHLVTPTGEMEILSGHVAVVTALKGGQTLRLRAANQLIRCTLAPGSFIRFENDAAEVLSAQYSFETEQAGEEQKA